MEHENLIQIRPQKNLPPRLTFMLVLRGIRYRLLRSSMTLAVITLAVVFFMSMLAGNAFLASVGNGVRKEIARERTAARLLTLVTAKPTSLGHTASLALLHHALASRDASERAQAQAELALYVGASGMDAIEFRGLVDGAQREKLLLDFFAELDFARRKALLGRVEGRDALLLLTDEAVRGKFLHALAGMGTVRLPMHRDEFAAFEAGYAAYLERQARFMNAWNQTIDRAAPILAGLAGEASIDEALSVADPGAQARWKSALEACGFAVSAAELARVCDQLAWAKEREAVQRALSQPDKRKKWRQIFFEDPPNLQKMAMLGQPRVGPILGGRYSQAQRERIAARFRAETRLGELEKKVDERSGGERVEGLSSRQVFLIVISFLVCMVGIANAMLIAITERYKEIATMKCLGATDSFILNMFTMEAAFQGAAGGLLGTLLGFLVELARGSLSWGSTLYRYFPAADLGQVALLSFAVGIGIAVVAAIYPSWAASRMLPMEAMRVD